MEWRAVLRTKGFREFLLRTVVFVLLFIAISFVIGQGVVRGPLLFDLHFQFYGGLGYVLLVMMLFFVVYAREKLFRLEAPKWGHWFFWVLTPVLVVWFRFLTEYISARPELPYTHFWLSFLSAHLVFLAIFLSLGLAVFNEGFVARFLKSFRKEIVVCLVIGLAFYASMRVVWLSWPYLSTAVAHIVYRMLDLTFDNVAFYPPMRLAVGSFRVLIGEACSGVFSIFLFTCLYLLIIALDWKKLNKTKALLLFPVTIVGLFLVNVLRVYLILLVGIFYNPEFAVSLFHSYIGMILFLAYFVGFMWLVYDWMKK